MPDPEALVELKRHLEISEKEKDRLKEKIQDDATELKRLRKLEAMGAVEASNPQQDNAFEAPAIDADDEFRAKTKVVRARYEGENNLEKSAVEEMVELRGTLQREERYSQALGQQLYELQIELQNHSDFKNDESIKYVEYLQRAKVENMTDLAALDFITVAGKDAQDRDVVTIAAANLPEKGTDLDRVLIYVLSVLKPIVDKEYVVVWLNTTMMDQETGADYVFRPAVGWFKDVHQMLPLQYRKNLHQVIVLHPDVWLKMQLQGLRWYLGSEALALIKHAESVEEMFKYLGRRRCVLPNYVYQKDVETEGVLLAAGDKMGKHLLATSRKIQWEQKMWEDEVSMRKELLGRNHEALDWLHKEKKRLVAEESYAEASLVKEESVALPTEIEDLEKDLHSIEEAKAADRQNRKKKLMDQNAPAEEEVKPVRVVSEASTESKEFKPAPGRGKATQIKPESTKPS